jgi:hypothetical protein
MTASSLSNGERETLYVTDAELIRRTGIPEKVARRLIRELDRLPSGFPPKDRLCGNRRYWPAVQDFFAARTAKIVASQQGRTRNDKAA